MIFDLIIAFVYISNLFDTNMALIVLFVGVFYTWLGTNMAAWTVKRRRRFNKAWVRWYRCSLQSTSDLVFSHSEQSRRRRTRPFITGRRFHTLTEPGTSVTAMQILSTNSMLLRETTITCSISGVPLRVSFSSSGAWPLLSWRPGECRKDWLLWEALSLSSATGPPSRVPLPACHIL